MNELERLDRDSIARELFVKWTESPTAPNPTDAGLREIAANAVRHANALVEAMR